MADLSLKDALLLAGGGTDSSGGSGGKDGVGIASLEINDDGELVVTLDNGRVKNLGWCRWCCICASYRRQKGSFIHD